MKTMCPPGYHHNGFVATHALGHMMYPMMYMMYMMHHAHDVHDMVFRITSAILPIFLTTSVIETEKVFIFQFFHRDN